MKSTKFKSRKLAVIWAILFLLQNIILVVLNGHDFPKTQIFYGDVSKPVWFFILVCFFAFIPLVMSIRCRAKAESKKWLLNISTIGLIYYIFGSVIISVCTIVILS